MGEHQRRFAASDGYDDHTLKQVTRLVMEADLKGIDDELVVNCFIAGLVAVTGNRERSAEEFRKLSELFACHAGDGNACKPGQA